MDPRIPASYKNYLPSKPIRLLLVVAIIIIVGIVIGPSLFKFSKQTISGMRSNQPPEPLIARPTNTTSNSFLNDGIPDWQKILVGLDPKDPASTQLFYERKQVLESQGLWDDTQNFTLDNQIGISIGNNLVEQGLVNDITIGQESGEEIIAYIEKLDASLKKYSRIDIEEDGAGDQQADLNYLNSFDILSKEFTALLQSNRMTIEAYFDNPTLQNKPVTFLAGTSRIIEKMLLLPVPSGPREIHLNIINMIYGMHQVINTYDSIPAQENIQRFAYVTLFQTKLADFSNMLTYLGAYIIIGSEERL
jgi:hypothetical protein